MTVFVAGQSLPSLKDAPVPGAQALRAGVVAEAALAAEQCTAVLQGHAYQARNVKTPQQDSDAHLEAGQPQGPVVHLTGRALEEEAQTAAAENETSSCVTALEPATNSKKHNHKTLPQDKSATHDLETTYL